MKKTMSEVLMRDRANWIAFKQKTAFAPVSENFEEGVPLVITFHPKLKTTVK